MRVVLGVSNDQLLCNTQKGQNLISVGESQYLKRTSLCMEVPLLPLLHFCKIPYLERRDPGLLSRGLLLLRWAAG